MAAMTAGEALELSQRLCIPLMVLIATMTVPQNHYSLLNNPVRKPATVLAIFYFSSSALHPHSMVNTLPSYLLGFLTVWILILSVVFVLYHNPAQDFQKVNISLSESDGRPTYKVEKYPLSKPLTHRLVWVLELLSDARGIGWKHSSRNIFRTAAGELYDPEYLASDKGHYKPRAKEVRTKFLRRNFWILVLDYFLVDICTHLMYHDAFLSGTEIHNPFFLSPSDGIQWLYLLPYRLIVAGAGVYSVIDLASKAVALVSVGIFGEKYFGSWGQYWNYPPVFGSFRSIWDRGLAGFWGDFWHPMFKFGLTSVAKSMVSIPKTPNTHPISTSIRRLCRLLIVFSLSGIMHAAGSWTLASGMPTPITTRPYPHLTLLAFVLQVPGIAIQQLLFHGFPPSPRQETTFKMAMLIFTCIWGLCTMPLLIADFAAGQLFKIPFLPVSIVDLVIRSSGSMMK